MHIREGVAAPYVDPLMENSTDDEMGDTRGSAFSMHRILFSDALMRSMMKVELVYCQVIFFIKKI